MKFLFIPADVDQPSRFVDMPDGLNTRGRLNFLYDLIECTTVEKVTVRLGDEEVDVWIDEEGLYKEPLVLNLRATMLTWLTFDQGEVNLFGNAVVAGFAGENMATLPERIVIFFEHGGQVSA